MPRIIGAVQNELNLDDNVSGGTIRLYYRTPTTKERQGYANLSIQRKRNKVVMNQTEARVRYGMKILTGIRDGDFMRVVDGKQVALSSTPGAPGYVENWKEVVVDGAADLIITMAAHVFDVPAEVASEEAEDAAEVTAGEDDSFEDAEKNSHETLPQ